MGNIPMKKKAIDDQENSMGDKTSKHSLAESEEESQGSTNQIILNQPQHKEESVVEAISAQTTPKPSNLDKTNVPAKIQAKTQANVFTKCRPDVGNIIYYSDDQEAIVIGFDKDGDVKVRKSDGSTSVWFLDKCVGVVPGMSDGKLEEIVQSPLNESDETSAPFRSWSKPQIDELKGGILNLGELPDINMEEEADIGDTIYYIDGQQGTVIGRDEDGDVKVTKADGTTSVWYWRKCTRAVRKVRAGEPVRYICGTVATVEGFDADGDIKVRKNDGRQAIWYRKKSVGLDVPVSKPGSRPASRAISRQPSENNLSVMGA